MRCQCQGQGLEWEGRAKEGESPVWCIPRAGGEGPRRNSLVAMGKGFLGCTEQDLILHEIRSPDVSGKGSFALSWEMKEKVLTLFSFCMGGLSDLLPLCLLTPHAPVYLTIHPFSSTFCCRQDRCACLYLFAWLSPSAPNWE